MRHTPIVSPAAPSEFDGTSAFNILIAYENFAAGKNAKQTYDLLAAELNPDCRCSNQMWKFDVLNIPKLREMAAQDARVADIIIISCSGDDLPQSVKDWIEDWIPQAHNALALVALFDSSGPGAGDSWAVRTFLMEMARRNGLEFFAQPDVGPDPEQQERALASLRSVVRPGLGFSRWGH